MTSFRDLGLPDPLLKAVEARGYQTPTPIQQAAIPVVAAGHDLAAEAQTGSGKTAAFALPILHRLSSSPSDATQVLVVVPTRELALQVAAVFKDLGRFAARSPKVLAVIGGEPIEQQLSALAVGASIVVGTPGRLRDLMSRPETSFARVNTLVLDEADKLLDAGFREALTALIADLPTDRQTLLLSATLPASVLNFCEGVLRDPITVRVDEVAGPAPSIAQRLYQVDRHARRPLLQHLYRAESWGQTLVFVASRKATENLAAKLHRHGLTAAALHGHLDQSERVAVLRRFQQRGVRILVATDLAARGIDFDKLDVVVSYDLPRSPEGYVHRLGRTGRAGQAGQAVSFVDHDTEAHFRLIEKRCHVALERQQVAGFELSGPAPERTRGPAPVKGRRKSKKDKLRELAARTTPAQKPEPS